MRNKGLFIDVFVLIFLIFLASVFAYLTRGLFIGRSLFIGAIFTVPPTIYLGIRKKKNWKKIGLATILFGFIFGFAFSFLAEYTLSWDVVSTIFPTKFLGITTLDTTIGIALMTLLIVTFYEHFIDKKINSPISKRFWIALIPSFLVVGLIILVFFISPDLLKTRYPYFYMGVVAILPVIYLSIKKPKLISKLATTSIYFFFLFLVIEIFAVKYNYWIYPGNNYIGWVKIFNLSFPFEELFFWMLFYSASIVSYYEILIDDEK